MDEYEKIDKKTELLDLSVKYKKRFTDRKDGRRLRTIEPMALTMTYFMRERNDANNLIKDCVDLENITKYVREKKAEGKTNLNAMHVLVAAYVRAVSQKPGVNRFVSGLRIYARHSIDVIMEVKKELKLNAPATMVKFHFKPEYTIDQIYEEMNNKITEYQNSSEEDEDNSMDKFVAFLSFCPRVVLRGIVRIIKWLDYHGWLPEWMTELSPMHGSLVLTSMGSLGIPSIYHHLYNFGNVPMFLSFSTKRHEYQMNREGQVENKHFLDFNFTTDDRICDGQYYSEALHEMRKYLKNPRLLETAPAVVVQDIR